MRALFITLCLSALVGVGLMACNNMAIGRECVNPTGTAVAGTQISSPALECPSRLCLLMPPKGMGGENPDAGDDSLARRTCTAFCSSNDDCDAETKKSCPSGFACAVATTSGDFCCKKMCICKDDLVEGENAADGGVATPFACDPMRNTDIQCKNVKK